METDANGWLCVTSNLGIQMLDQVGRVNGVIENPTESASEQIVFGGEKREVMYAFSNKWLYRRKTKGTRVALFLEPVKPPNVRL